MAEGTDSVKRNSSSIPVDAEADVKSAVADIESVWMFIDLGSH